MAESQLLPLDRIHIVDLLVRCIIGTLPEEREKSQDVMINITLYADLHAACRSDRLDDTVDYSALKQRIVRMTEGSSFQLVETLAQAIADLCLAEARVRRVSVRVEKPTALRFARSVGVEIERENRI
jgi:FolB domain-containing protein